MHDGWLIARPGREPIRVHARDVVDGDFDEVMFHAHHWRSPWRVVRKLGNRPARVEHWTDNGNEWFHYETYPGRTPQEVAPVLDLVNSLPEGQICELLGSFQATRTAEDSARHDQALRSLGTAQREVDRTAATVAQSWAKEAALNLPPGPLQDTAISLARGWEGDPADLLRAAEGISQSAEEDR